MTGERRLAELARKARRVQDAVARIRGAAVVGEVRIEVAPDGRITGLTAPDQALAQAVSTAHAEALRRAQVQTATLRAELADDPIVRAALHLFAPDDPAPPPRLPFHPTSDPEEVNPYALPTPIRRRYGLG
ncbi:hypothetical protein ACIP5Y_35215 [Nocardia sp. NPDC088792]|uniref:hypothetical protein n=1 Tax=Nocardia sp. NPDC088792 TaxID=3364332 RepID=UPI003807816C